MSLSAPPAAANFLSAHGWAEAQVVPLAGDASFRRYFRVHRGGRQAVLMEAPPQLEALEPFVAVGRYLAGLDLSVPQVLAADAGHGFALLEDLGDGLFPAAIAAGANERQLYEAATDVLAHVHGVPCPAVLPGIARPHLLPRFDAARLQDEVDRVLDWYWPELFDQPASPDDRAGYHAVWAPLWPMLAFSPPALVQFDYHSPNLLWLPHREGLARVGILDFQDALIGPGAYDLVSLLQDPRRDLPPGLEPLLVDRYLAASEQLDIEQFLAAYAILGAQRAARILGTFVRLWRRDGKPGYLRHQRRVWQHLETCLHHPVLAGVRDWFDGHVPAAGRAALWETQG